MGLLSGLFGYNGGGLQLGGEDNPYDAYASAAPGNVPGDLNKRPGLFGGLADSLNNPIFQFGMGLASGATPQEGFGNALASIYARQKLAQAGLTSDIKEYQYAKQQGFEGSFADWQRQQANLRDREQWGLNPVPYYDKESGEFKLGQPSNKGNFKTLNIPGSATDKSQVIQTPQGVIVQPQRIVPGAPAPSTSPGGGGVGPQGGGFIPKEYESPEEQKKVGEGYGKEFTSIQDDGRKAQQMIQTYTRMGQLNDQAYQGAGAPGVQYARSLLSTFGVDPGSVPPGEELVMLSNRLVLDATGGSLGNQISNADRDYIQATNPSLSNTREGRARMIDTGVKLAQRKVETAQLAREYRAKNGSMKGFDQFMVDYAEKHPLFPKVERSNTGTTRSGIKWSID